MGFSSKKIGWFIAPRHGLDERGGGVSKLSKLRSIMIYHRIGTGTRGMIEKNESRTRPSFSLNVLSVHIDSTIRSARAIRTFPCRSIASFLRTCADPHRVAPSLSVDDLPFSSLAGRTATGGADRVIRSKEEEGSFVRWKHDAYCADLLLLLLLRHRHAVADMRTLVNSATGLRRYLHRHPRVSNDEMETAERLKAWLIEHGEGRIRIVAENLGGGAGFLACVSSSTENSAENATLLRADMDALPLEERADVAWRSSVQGAHHACGHDGHSVSLALALAMIAKRPEKTIPHRSSLFALFQAAEETGEGALAALSDSRFSHLPINRGVFGLHNIPGADIGSVILVDGLTAPASMGWTVHLRGERGHSSSSSLRSPVPALAKLTLLASDPSRDIFPPDSLCTVVSVRTSGDSANFGVSPGSASLSLTLRAKSFEDIRSMRASMEGIAEDLKTSMALVAVEFTTHEPFAETVSAPVHSAVVKASADALNYPTLTRLKPFPWSEDCGALISHWPCGGCFFGIGGGMDLPSLHSETYDWPDSLTEIAANLWTEIARHSLSNN